jgi:hypothetical protein
VPEPRRFPLTGVAGAGASAVAGSDAVAHGARAKSSYHQRMGRSRTGRLGRRRAAVLLGLGAGVALAACGFSGLGAAPVASEGGAGNGNGNDNSDGAAGDGNPAFTEGGVIVVGGEGGSASDAALDGGADPADGAPFTCPAACTTCTGTTCNIVCDLTHPCATPITCPPGLPCHVTCDSPDACMMHEISCTMASSCLVDCTQLHACQMTSVHCGSGKCRLDCTGFVDACVSVNLDGMNAASLCLQCEPIAGNPSCRATDGKKPMAGKPCELVCGAGGCNATGNGFNSCSSTSTCP